MNKSQKQQAIKLLKPIIENILKEDYKFNIHDSILREITFDELITTIESNEPDVTEQTVLRVFNELLAANVRDAKSEIRTNMKLILTKLS